MLPCLKQKLILENLSLWLQLVIVYQLSERLLCNVNQSGITTELKSSTAVSWCWWGHDWQAGEVVPPVFSKSAYWCPGNTFTSQHTSSPLAAHFHQPSPSPKWSAWKPPQQSALQEYFSRVWICATDTTWTAPTSWHSNLSLPHSPWLRTPWTQLPRNQQVFFPPLAW